MRFCSAAQRDRDRDERRERRYRQHGRGEECERLLRLAGRDVALRAVHGRVQRDDDHQDREARPGPTELAMNRGSARRDERRLRDEQRDPRAEHEAVDAERGIERRRLKVRPQVVRPREAEQHRERRRDCHARIERAIVRARASRRGVEDGGGGPHGTGMLAEHRGTTNENGDIPLFAREGSAPARCGREKRNVPVFASGTPLRCGRKMPLSGEGHE